MAVHGKDLVGKAGWWILQYVDIRLQPPFIQVRCNVQKVWRNYARPVWTPLRKSHNLPHAPPARRHTDCPHSARENGLQAAFSTSRITLLQWCTSHHLPPNLSSHIQNRFVRWKPTYAGLSSPSVCPASKRFHGQTTTPITDPDPWPQNLQVAKPIKVIVTGSVQELKRGIWLLDRPTNVMSRFSAIKTLFYVWFLLKVYAYIAFYK